MSIGTNLFVTNHSVSGEEVALTDASGNKQLVRGTTVPSATGTGYAIGCVFIKSSSNSAGTTVYINEGSATSCLFTALSPVNKTSKALAASGGDALDPTAATVFTVTPTASETITAASGPLGKVVYVKVLTSGTSSYTITFGTGFKVTGTLATGTSDAKTFILQFVGDGTNMVEVSRTAAM